MKTDYKINWVFILRCFYHLGASIGVKWLVGAGGTGVDVVLTSMVEDGVPILTILVCCCGTATEVEAVAALVVGSGVTVN